MVLTSPDKSFEQPQWTPGDSYVFESTQEIMTKTAAFYVAEAIAAYETDGTESGAYNENISTARAIFEDKKKLDPLNRSQIDTMHNKYVTLFQELYPR